MWQKFIQDEDGLAFFATDGDGTFLQVSINRLINRQAQVTFLFTLKDGTSYQLPSKINLRNAQKRKQTSSQDDNYFEVAPDTLFSNVDANGSFNTNAGLKFQLIEAMRKWRIIYNGIATRRSGGEVPMCSVLLSN